MDFLRQNSPNWQRWASIIAGSTLATYGISRRSAGGAAMALVGGYFVYQGAVPLADVGPTELTIIHALNINAPSADLYRFWRDFNNLPMFMRHLRSVAVESSGRSHWVARGPAGRDVEWDAEITDDRNGKRIAWRSLPGSDVMHEGSVEFRRATGDRGTVVRVHLHWSPPGGRFGAMMARIFGEHPEQQIREDLRRMKRLIETGEIPTTVGQPSGRRSAKIRVMEPFDREQVVA